MKVNLERAAVYPRPTPAVARPTPGGPSAGEGPAFGSRIKQAFAAVESSAKASDQASDDLVAGKIDLHEALVQMEKADLTLKLGTTVRNKLLDAYQQLMNSAGG